MRTMFTVLLVDEPLGTSALESFDSGMGVATGRFCPVPAYEAVRPVFRLFADAQAETGPCDEVLLARYYAERDALPLRLVDASGMDVPTSAIHINDFSREAGEQEGYWLAVYLSERDPRFTTAGDEVDRDE